MKSDGTAAYYADFGGRVRDARLKRTPPLTQGELARMVGLTRTSITNLERGRQKCLLHTVLDIAAAVGVDAATLLPPRAAAGPVFEARLGERAAPEAQWIRATLAARGG